MRLHLQRRRKRDERQIRGGPRQPRATFVQRSAASAVRPPSPPAPTHTTLLHPIPKQPRHKVTPVTTHLSAKLLQLLVHLGELVGQRLGLALQRGVLQRASLEVRLPVPLGGVHRPALLKLLRGLVAHDAHMVGCGTGGGTCVRECVGERVKGELAVTRQQRSNTAVLYAAAPPPLQSPAAGGVGGGEEGAHSTHRAG